MARRSVASGRSKKKVASLKRRRISGARAERELHVARNRARPCDTADTTERAVLNRPSLSPTRELFIPERSNAMVGTPAVVPAALATADLAAPGGPRNRQPCAS